MVSVLKTYTSGQLQKEYFLYDSLLEGQSTEYFENGFVSLRENWHLGNRNGSSVKYYSNGNVCERGDYNNGLRTGCWFGYYENNNIREFKDYFFHDSINAQESKYPNRYVTFDTLGRVEFNSYTMYHELNKVDSASRDYLFTLFLLPAKTKCTIIYRHRDDGISDTLREDENPVIFRLKNDSDFVFGRVRCITDTIWADGKWHYQEFNSYFDTRKTTCNLPADIW